MAGRTSRRCSICGINYPADVLTCRVLGCGRRTDFISNDGSDEDWEATVAERNAPEVADWTARQVIDWRLDCLIRAGYSVPLAIEVSLRYRGPDAIDLHEACALLERGCPPALLEEVLL